MKRVIVSVQRNQTHVAIQPKDSTNKHANVNAHELRSVPEVKSSITKHVSVNVLHPNQNAQEGKVSTRFLVNVSAQTSLIAALIRIRYLTIIRAVANVLAIKNVQVHKFSTNRLVSVSVQKPQLHAQQLRHSTNHPVNAFAQTSQSGVLTDRHSMKIAANADVQRCCDAREDNVSTLERANVNAQSLHQHALLPKDTMTLVVSVSVPTSRRVVLTLGNSLITRHASVFVQKSWFAQEVSILMHRDVYVNALTNIHLALQHNISISYLVNVSARISLNDVPTLGKCLTKNCVNVRAPKSNTVLEINVSTERPANASVPLLGPSAQKHSYTTK